MIWTIPIIATSIQKSSDADVTRYINAVQAAGRTLSSNEQDYIRTYIVGLKNAGIWNSIYDRGIPIWGTEAPSLVTLKGVSTLTNHGATFSSTGADFDGVSTYIDTGIIPSATLVLNSTHVAYYTGQTTTVTANFDMGTNSASGLIRLSIRQPNNASIQMYLTTANVTQPNTAAGYFCGSRISSSDLQIYKNGSSLGSTSNTGSGLSTNSIFLGASNNLGTASGFANRNCQLWSVGTGITSTQAADDYTLTQAFMTSMGIQV